MKLLLSACIALLFCLSLEANAQTSCDDWANFTKIITYRFRGTSSQTPRLVGDVKAELRRIKNGDPEMDYALKWVGFTYAHPELSPADVRKAVYKQCNIDGAI